MWHCIAQCMGPNASEDIPAPILKVEERCHLSNYTAFLTQDHVLIHKNLKLCVGGEVGRRGVCVSIIWRGRDVLCPWAQQNAFLACVGTKAHMITVLLLLEPALLVLSHSFKRADDLIVSALMKCINLNKTCSLALLFQSVLHERKYTEWWRKSWTLL